MHVRFREVVALEEQRCVHGCGKRVGHAIGKIQPRLWIDALAVAVKSRQRRARLALVEGDNLEIVFVLEKPLHTLGSGHAVTGA